MANEKVKSVDEGQRKVIESLAGFWRRLSGPLKIGIFFGAIAIVMAVAGLIREGNTSPLSYFLAIVISGGTWALVSWAIATAVVEVERDVAESEEED